MMPASKQVIAISQVSTTAAGSAFGIVDRKGADFCALNMIMSTSSAVTTKPTVLKLMESDSSATDFSTFTNISGAVGGTDFTIPNAVTQGNWGMQFNVDCRARMRYLGILVSPAATQVTTVIATLMRLKETPVDATGANVKGLVSI